METAAREEICWCRCLTCRAIVCVVVSALTHPIFKAPISEVQALIDSYARLGFYTQLRKLCSELLKQNGNDPEIRFWRAFALSEVGAYSEALADLQMVSQLPDIALAACALQISINKLTGIGWYR